MGIVSIVKEDSVCLMDKGKAVLRIQETVQDKAVNIVLEGDLRSDTAHALGDELKTLVLLNHNLLVDFQKVSGLSTSCCRALLSIQQTIDNNEKGSMKLVRIPAAILEKMNATGLTALLLIENSKEK